MQNNELVRLLDHSAVFCENLQAVFDQSRSLSRRFTNEGVAYWLNLLNVQEVEGENQIFVGNPGYALDLSEWPALSIDESGNIRIFGLLLSEMNSMIATMAALVTFADAGNVTTAAYGAFIDKAAVMTAYR